MIFTRHFGALAARPVFPSITEAEQEHNADLQSADADTDAGREAAMTAA